MVDEAAISIVTELSDDEIEAIGRLLPQLSSSASFGKALIEGVLAHPGSDLLVARVGERLVGMATLVSFPLPTGLRGHVEDVVVDEAYRGRGIAKKLLESMTEIAGAKGFRTLDLTSRPSRAAAIRLYEAVGFRRRDSVVMRFEPTR